MGVVAEAQHQGEWLRLEIARKGYSQSAFARRVAVSRDALQKWFRQEEIKIRPDILWKLLDALGFDEHWRRGASTKAIGMDLKDPFGALAVAMTAEDDVSGGAPPVNEPNVSPADVRKLVSGQTMRSVPILNRIPAGPFMDERMRDFVVSRDGGWVEAPVGNTEAFALWVDGDSMSPRYEDGDLVIFKSVDPERHAIIDGGDYAIQLSGDHFYEQTFKRLFNHPEHGPFFVIATALNPHTRPQQVELRRNQISRLGLAWMVFPKQG